MGPDGDRQALRERRRHRVGARRRRGQDALDVVGFVVVTAWLSSWVVCLLVPGYGWLGPPLATLVVAALAALALAWARHRWHRRRTRAG